MCSTVQGPSGVTRIGSVPCPVPVWQLSDSEVEAALVDVEAAQARLVARRAELVREAGSPQPRRDDRAVGGPDGEPAGERAKWTGNGRTDLANGVLVCELHHQKIHREGWTAQLAPNGYPTSSRPRRSTPSADLASTTATG